MILFQPLCSIRYEQYLRFFNVLRLKKLTLNYQTNFHIMINTISKLFNSYNYILNCEKEVIAWLFGLVTETAMLTKEKLMTLFLQLWQKVCVCLCHPSKRSVQSNSS